MSYKHNNLIAMRQQYWDNEDSLQIRDEKQFLQQLLIQENIFNQANLEDAKYLFFVLPSNIIVKGHALGFQDERVRNMMVAYIQSHKTFLMQKHPLKIQFNF